MATQWTAPEFGEPHVLRQIEVDAPDPGTGEVRIRVVAAGLNPADYKRFAGGPNADPGTLPVRPGFEVSGVVDAVGPDTRIASGEVSPGDEVLAFRITGGYSTAVTVPASDVFAKPATLDHAQAANLFLAGTTAAEMLHVSGVGRGDTIVVHGASGAVGVSVLQQAAQLGANVVGTAGERSFDVVRRFGAAPVAYGVGLEGRLRDAAPDGYAAALDTVGTDEAVDTSLALVSDRSRIVTIAAFGRAQGDGIRAIGGMMPDSARYRDEIRSHLIELAAAGRLTVPVARTFPFDEAVEALELLRSGHPGGKLALLTDG